MEKLFDRILTLLLAKFMLNDVPHAAGMVTEYKVTITESDGHISAFIPGERASADLSAIEPELLINFGIGRIAKGWYFFNRLINQSGKQGLGTLILDKVLAYCQEHGYSILNQVNAYGNLNQAQLERWYISKGFKPVNYKMYKNSVLKWEPRVLSYIAQKPRASDVEPPTPAQIRYITNLCMRLGIREPLEENVHTKGEAGRLIRDLEARRRVG